jgi:hypothetical protein
VLWYTSAPAFAAGTVFAEPMLFPLTPCAHNNPHIIPLYNRLLSTTKADGRGVERVQLHPIPAGWYAQARDRRRGGTPTVKDLFVELLADGLLPLGLLRGGQVLPATARAAALRRQCARAPLTPGCAPRHRSQRPQLRTRTHGAAEFWTKAASPYVLPCPNSAWKIHPEDSVYVLVSS